MCPTGLKTRKSQQLQRVATANTELPPQQLYRLPTPSYTPTRIYMPQINWLAHLRAQYPSYVWMLPANLGVIALCLSHFIFPMYGQSSRWLLSQPLSFLGYLYHACLHNLGLLAETLANTMYNYTITLYSATQRLSLAVQISTATILLAWQWCTIITSTTPSIRNW